MFRLTFRPRSFLLPFLDSVKQVVKKQVMATAAVGVTEVDLVPKIAKNLVQNVRSKEVSSLVCLYQYYHGCPFTNR